MSIARLESAEDSFELSWTHDGDYLLSIIVVSYGYSGHASGHVVNPQFESFRSSLATLEKTRQGTASITSFLSGDFEFTIGSIDRVGHMGVSGRLRFDNLSGNWLHLNELRFSFEFDPSELSGFIDAVGV